MFCLLFLILTVTHVKSRKYSKKIFTNFLILLINQKKKNKCFALEYAAPCVTPNQLSGLCMPVKSCKPIYEFLLQIEKNGGTISDHEKSKLSQYHCGTFKNVPHVCCPEKAIQLNVVGFNILKNVTCGVYSINTIANGQEAAPFQYPWMALLKYKDPNSPFKCGGTLISDRKF